MRIQFYFLFVLLSHLILSQNVQKKEVCMLCKSEDYLHVSPYDFSLKKELPFVITSVGALLIGKLLNQTARLDAFTESEVEALDRNDVNRFDRSATYNYDPQAAEISDYFRLGVVVMPALFLTNRHTRKDIKGLAILTLEVVSINYGLTNSVKYLVNRTRPLVYNENVPIDIRTDAQSRLSFFSGHTSHTAAVSFMFAKVINDYHPNLSTSKKIYLWGAAGSIPVLTGYLRVKSGKHYTTDVIAGGLFGAAIGWVVPHLHKIKSQVKLSPYSYRDANGISLTYKF